MKKTLRFLFGLSAILVFFTSFSAMSEQRQPDTLLAKSILVPRNAVSAQVLSKQQIFNCLMVQTEADAHKKDLMDSGQRVSDAEMQLLAQEQALQQQTLQLDKLEATGDVSAAMQRRVRVLTNDYNQQLLNFNQRRQHYQLLLANHNQQISAYNQFIAGYQGTCSNKKYFEQDLKQVQLELSLSEN